MWKQFRICLVLFMYFQSLAQPRVFFFVFFSRNQAEKVIKIIKILLYYYFYIIILFVTGVYICGNIEFLEFESMFLSD